MWQMTCDMWQCDIVTCDMWQMTCASKCQDLQPTPTVRSNCPRLKCTCRILPTRINHHSNTSSHTNYPNYEYCQKVYEWVNNLDYRRYLPLPISLFDVWHTPHTVSSSTRKNMCCCCFADFRWGGWMRQAMQNCNWRSKYLPCFSNRFVSVQRSSIFDLEIKPFLARDRILNIEDWRSAASKYWLDIISSEPISQIARKLVSSSLPDWPW